MKKLVLALTTFPILLSAANAAVEGETSTINFTGKIVESTCSVDNDSKGKVVDLGNVSANTFSAANDTSLEKDFTIQLNDCSTSAYQNAKITFRGETATSSGTELEVTGGATNIGLQILESGSPISIDGSASSTPKVLDTGTNTFDFTTRYIALDSVVGTGDANATVNFTVEYE